MAQTQVTGQQIANGASGVNLTVDVTGTLPVANGGTNATTAAAARTSLGISRADTPVRNAYVASSATPTPAADFYDQYNLTAQAAAAAIAAPTGTVTDGTSLIFRIKDNGTARALTWNAVYRAIGVTLPTTTVVSKTLYVGCKWNSTDAVWDVLAVSQQA